MKLTGKQRDKLLFMSSYLDTLLEAERTVSGKTEEEHADDEVYNALMAVIGNIEHALEQDNMLINTLF